MSNFSFLRDKFPLLAQLGEKGEQYLYTDPNACLYKLRILGEQIVELMFQYDKEPDPTDHTQVQRIRYLEAEDYLTADVARSLTILRKMGNKAVHDNYASERDAGLCLQVAYGICEWFMMTYGEKGFNYTHRPFVMPQKTPALAVVPVTPAAAPSATVPAASAASAAPAPSAASVSPAAQAASAAPRSGLTPKEKALAKAAAQAAQKAPKVPKKQRIAQNAKAAYHRDISEAETRYLIDAQLRQVGWEVDSQNLTYAKGTRPARNTCRAIAEWPTAATDPTEKSIRKAHRADYALFIGKQLVGIIEAKKRFKDVSSVLDDQCREYATHIRPQDQAYLIGKWGSYQVPFLFASNGRPYIRQCKIESGIWFRDVRRPDNAPKALLGWMSPDGLRTLLERDIPKENKALEALGDALLKDPNGLNLYSYQIAAVKKTEKAVQQGKKRILLAMATGTGKTRVILALIYRFLKSGRFHRILYLVDRNTLGEQAYDKFTEVKLEDLKSLDKIYNVNKLTDTTLAPETKVQIATVQSMIRRLFGHTEEAIPSVSAFDLVIVDEAHRGYLLDKEMSQNELVYRDEAAYQSQYRRVLDYFDGVKIGLTATPALHTTEIFGKPIYQYTYREAVIDGYLIDHDAPIQIETELTKNGIHLKKGSQVNVLRPDNPGKVDTTTLADDVDFDVEDFNKNVITEGFNRAVLTELSKHIDPSSPRDSGKTLIFAATDRHADMVVQLLKKIYTQMGVSADAIVKITGASYGGDRKKISDAIKRFKNEDYPSVVVTVDLLTTGVDVPSITNLVFLRRVKSRILFEQMLGRATRRCDAIHKAKFDIYDAVGEFAKMAKVTDMKPVATSVTTSFKDLFAGLKTLTGETGIKEQVDQIVVKLQRKWPRLQPDAQKNLLLALGTKDVKTYVHQLRQKPLDQVKQELLSKENALTKLDSHSYTIIDPKPLYIADDPDKIVDITRGYGKDNTTKRPQDYLREFDDYIRNNQNKIAALHILCTKPRDLKRSDLKKLIAELDLEGYTEKKLNTALKEVNSKKASSQDMAADIISLIRKAALGSPLVSHEERVRRAMEKLRQNHTFTKTEENWLKRFEDVLQNEEIFNRESLDEDSRFKKAGGFNQINKAFGNQLEAILDELNDYLYEDNTNGGNLA